MKVEKEIRVQGFCVSEGIAIGEMFFLPSHSHETIKETDLSDDQLDSEVQRYNQAIDKSRDDLLFLHFKLKAQNSDEASEIIDSHIQMLSDPLMTQQVEEMIIAKKKNAEFVFSFVIREYEKKFSQIKDSFFQQRIVDVLDVSKRVLDHLSGKTALANLSVPEGAIVLTKELVPSHIAALGSCQIGGFVTQQGGSSSHAALIAKAKGIAYVSNVDLGVFTSEERGLVIVDGKKGEVILHPSPETEKKYRELKTSLKITNQLLQQDLFPKAETLDGYVVHVHGNVGTLSDLDEMDQFHPESIGLFRSEYLFLEKNVVFLSEDEQMRSYEKVASAVGDIPLVMRVFDVGGDKNHDGFLEQDLETNPVLGCRGIRFLLRHPAVFRVQIRALLRAFSGRPLKLLLPLVSDPHEVIEAKRLVDLVQDELVDNGLATKQKIPLGCMIEVPSAALMCGALASQVDFFSIGSNDLLQYTLGMDRGNSAKQGFFCPVHPSVLKLIKQISTEAKKSDTPVTLCGDMASNPLYTSLLLGLGISEFSCSMRHIPLVRRAIRRASLIDSFRLAQRVLQMSCHVKITQLLTEIFQD